MPVDAPGIHKTANVLFAWAFAAVASLGAADKPVSFTCGHPACLRKQLLEVSRRRHSAFQARPADSRGRAEGRRTGRGDRSREGRGEPAVPPGRGTREAVHADGRQAHRRPDCRQSRSGSTRARPGTPRPNRASTDAGHRHWRRSRRCRFLRRRAIIGRFRSRCELPCRRFPRLHESDRSLPGKGAPRQGAQGRAARRSHHSAATGLHGPDRAAADAGRDRRIPGRQLAAAPGSI